MDILSYRILYLNRKSKFKRMKKTISFLLFTSMISFTGISQITQAEKDSIEKYNNKVIADAVKEILSDEDLRPYEVSANHGNFRGKIMDIIKRNQDSVIIKITQLPRFSGVLFLQENGKMKEISGIPSIAKIIDDLQSQIPTSISSKPDEIWDDYFLGDSTHIETWYFKNNNDKKCEFAVTFTNGQITVFTFKI
jgi:hypothetical protein